MVNPEKNDIELLSDDELDAVAGGHTNAETPYFRAFYEGLMAGFNKAQDSGN